MLLIIYELHDNPCIESRVLPKGLTDCFLRLTWIKVVTHDKILTDVEHGRASRKSFD